MRASAGRLLTINYEIIISEKVRTYRLIDNTIANLNVDFTEVKKTQTAVIFGVNVQPLCLLSKTFLFVRQYKDNSFSFSARFQTRIGATIILRAAIAKCPTTNSDNNFQKKSQLLLPILRPNTRVIHTRSGSLSS